jgi:hypothetical protein
MVKMELQNYDLQISMQAIEQDISHKVKLREKEDDKVILETELKKCL